METLAGGIRNGILNLKLSTLNELYCSYMPFVEGGGLFIPTRKSYSLGDEVFILLNLVDDEEKIPVTGKVVWISPKGMGSSRKQGVGIQLNSKHNDLVSKIETNLAGLLESTDQTFTM